MLKLLKTFPGNVLGVSAEGTVTGHDYETVLIPAIETMLESHRKLRLLYHLGSEFQGFDLKAVADDAVLSLKQFTNWEKVALVSDNTIITTLVKFFGYILPGEIKIFKDKELDDAKNWIIA